MFRTQFSKCLARALRRLKNWIGWSLFSVESPLTCKVFVLKYWTQVLLCCVLLVKAPFYPSALQTGGVLSQFRRADGWLPDLRNPYLCNHLTDFLDSKFCGIVQACSCALSWSFDPYGLAHGPKTCQIWHKSGPDFAERISLKIRDGFSPFKVLWTCLEL